MSEGLAFTFAGQGFIARSSGALYWPQEGALLLADLHLGKSERMARRGGALLPPWESADTLAKLERELIALAPKRVICLGDSFDDPMAEAALPPELRDKITALQKGRIWDWLSGNHDPSGGYNRQADLHLSGINLRHHIGQGPDISGHFHPAMRLGGKFWRCFVQSDDHLILPAFGHYTGGLDIRSPAFTQHLPKGIALICADRVFKAPYP